MINLLYYQHWIDKWKYVPYISVTCKVLKSCRSKMATLAHDVCDVRGACSLYIKTCRQSSFTYVYRVYMYICTQGFPYGGIGEVPPTKQKFSYPLPPHQVFVSSPPKANSTQWKNKNVIFSCSHCSGTIFVLNFILFWKTGHAILILTDVQYSQNTAFSFEKFSNRQNYSFSGSLDLVKKSPQQCILLFNTKSGKLVPFSSIQYFGNLGVNLSS